MIVKVVIPALNEENALAQVLRDVPDAVDEVIVVDNGSKDQTPHIAQQQGATLLKEPTPGYGRACLKAMGYLSTQQPLPEVVVFLDADYADHPEELTQLLAPIRLGEADMVLGSRMLGQRERGAMNLAQRYGNGLACFLLKHLYGAHFTDLGPFRAIRYDALLSLNMRDKTYGWTVEMQLKATKKRLRCVEIPVRYRKRLGKSKISGTLMGVIKAGYKILHTLFIYR